MNEMGQNSWYDLDAANASLRAAGEATQDERVLVGAARKGNLGAYNRLVLQYQDLAYNLAFRILLDEDSAQEVTQNSFLAVFRNLRSFHGFVFKSWLISIVTNACMDLLRRDQSHSTPSPETVHNDEEEIKSSYWIPDRPLMAVAVQESAELQAAIYRSLKAISVEYRAVLVLADIEGLNNNEIATILGEPHDTIRSRLARARMQMRATLEPTG